MAFNEEKNIGKLLESIQKQNLKNVLIVEVIVVSSGSTDKTDRIIKAFSKKKKKIRLIIEPKRKGKSAAVNVFLAKAKSNIIIVMSADVILKIDTVENLVTPFKNPRVGIVGSHPVPINNPSSFMGYAAVLLWNLHHQISLKKPKMGEVIAFRKVFKKIPIISAVDEANIEPLIRGQGYKPYYAPDAIVYNKGPETVGEFIARRRHIYAGHLAAKHEYSYEVSTLKGVSIFFLLLKNARFSFKFLFWTPLIILLEIYSRFLGYMDYKFKLKDHRIWEITPSTKKLT